MPSCVVRNSSVRRWSRDERREVWTFEFFFTQETLLSPSPRRWGFRSLAGKQKGLECLVRWSQHKRKSHFSTGIFCRVRSDRLKAVEGMEPALLNEYSGDGTLKLNIKSELEKCLVAYFWCDLSTV